jgi:hypothetical protein
MPVGVRRPAGVSRTEKENSLDSDSRWCYFFSMMLKIQQEMQQ